MPEFQALFNETCYKVMSRDEKLIPTMIESALKIIPKDISKYGQARIMEQNYYDTEDTRNTCVHYIPLTASEYNDTVKKYQEMEDKTNEKVVELFTFKNAENRQFEVDDTRDVGCAYGGKQKRAIKYDQYHPEIVQFNPTNESEMDYFEDYVRELLYTSIILELILQISIESPEKNQFECSQNIGRCLSRLSRKVFT